MKKILPCLIFAALFGLALSIEAADVGTSVSESGQAKQDRVKRMTTDELIDGLKKSPRSLGLIHRLRRKSDKKAIPALKSAFEKAERKVEKQAAAAALVALGEDGPYWEYLASLASAAIDSDMPMPVLFSADGKPEKGFTPAFSAWCKKKGLPENETAHEAIYERPSDVLFIGMANTKKAAPLLMRGLESDNVFIAKRAAQGLANLKDNEGARAIREAAKRPGIKASTLAETLIYFDDADSQMDFERYAKDGEIKKALRASAKRRGTKNVWGEE